MPVVFEPCGWNGLRTALGVEGSNRGSDEDDEVDEDGLGDEVDGDDEQDGGGDEADIARAAASSPNMRNLSSLTCCQGMLPVLTTRVYSSDAMFIIEHSRKGPVSSIG